MQSFQKLIQGIWKESTVRVTNVICFGDDLIWAGTSTFKDTIKYLRDTFNSGTKNTRWQLKTKPPKNQK